MITSRRGFITGLGALLAAPAIVRASSLMPVKAFDPWGFSEVTSDAYWISGEGFHRYSLALSDSFAEFKEIQAANIFNCDASGWLTPGK